MRMSNFLTEEEKREWDRVYRKMKEEAERFYRKWRKESLKKPLRY